MNLLISLITTVTIALNTITIDLTTINNQRPIDIFTEVYDAIYNAEEKFNTEYIILDMESIYFIDTIYEER